MLLLWRPFGNYEWVFDFSHDSRLCRAMDVALGGTDREICEEGWLLVSTLAIKVLADQIGRFLIGRHENMVRPDMPNSKEPVSAVQNRSPMDLAASLC